VCEFYFGSEENRTAGVGADVPFFGQLGHTIFENDFIFNFYFKFEYTILFETHLYH
jgi:hypothetical protein